MGIIAKVKQQAKQAVPNAVNPNTGRQYKEGRGPGTIANLSRKDILGRLEDPPDAKRRKDLEKLAAQAAAGDPAALDNLYKLGALPGSEGAGAATRDARNYARYLYGNVTGNDVDYVKPGDAYVGDDIGSVLKVAAPIAGALIPGVGMLGAAAIGGLGNAGGQYLERGRINPLQAGLAGLGAAAGNQLLGNGLGSTGGLGGVPGGSTAATGVGGLGGDAVSTGVNAAGAAGGGGVAGAAGTAANVAGKAGGILGTVKKYGGPILAGLGAINAANQGAQADKLRQQALQYAAQDYNQRAPIRQLAQERLLAPITPRIDLGTRVTNRANPYAAR